MRVCPSCGRENPANRDFCVCGEYLRWEPTQHIDALEPAAPDAGAPVADHAHEVGAGPATGPAESELTLAPAGPALVAPQQGIASASVRSGAAVGQAGGPPPGAVRLLLRGPDEEEQATGPVSTPVKPGERVVLVGLIRNESGVVDNYDIAVRGLPAGWWTVTPATVYLVPFGTSGSYEQEFQVHVHPPRSPDAHAKPWAYEVTAVSRAYQAEVASASATVKIEPYREVSGKVMPDRGSGRLKARFLLTLRNRANAPVEVALSAEDAEGECEFRFAQPTVRIDPGRGLEAPFTVFPPKQMWIGRPKDRPIRVTATPVGETQPQPPLPATYRQRAWLPWWLAVVAPLAAAIAVAVILLMPKQTVVPNLKQASSVFAAQKLLTAAGLKLAPDVGQVTAQGSVVPGSVVDQTPAVGTKVKKGSTVSILVAVAPAKVPVPSVVGLTPETAGTQLRAAGLVLGTVQPKPDQNGKIASQIPMAQTQAARGSPVDVYLQPAASAKASAAAGAAGAAGGAAAGAAGANGKSGSAGGKAGAAGGKPVVIPTVSGSAMASAQQLSQAGLVPSMGEQFSTRPAGTPVGTMPPAGTSVPVGSKVEVLVSAGYPELSFDNGTQISLAVQGGAKIDTVPTSGQPQSDASWSADGTRLVYVQGPANAGQLVLIAPGQTNAQPFPLTGPGANDRDPSFAPSTSLKLLAYVDVSGGRSRLCFAIVGPNALNPDCTSHPGWTLGRQVAWSPDGSTILVFGSRNGTNNTIFGLIRFVSNVPFATQASLWGHGTVVTDISKPRQGVIAGAYSPDGKQVAIVSNTGTLDFHVFLTDPADFKLAHAKALPNRACQVSWRPDGKELAIMQADSACASTLGDIVAVNPRQPNTSTAIATQVANPAWQPLSLGG